LLHETRRERAKKMKTHYRTVTKKQGKEKRSKRERERERDRTL
jgi:hypothetical protein